MTVCARCGAQPEDSAQQPPLTWSAAVERGRTVHFCEACSRENLRSMEARLDSEWW